MGTIRIFLLFNCQTPVNSIRHLQRRPIVVPLYEFVDLIQL